MFLVSCFKCGEILGYHKEREKEEYEEHTSINTILSTIILALIREAYQTYETAYAPLPEKRLISLDL